MSIAAIVCGGLGPAGSASFCLRGFTPIPLTPAAGFQLVLAGPAPWDTDSIFDADSTAGDYAEFSLLAAPSGVSLTIGSDGLPVLGGAVSGRQSFQYREWIVASSSWLPITGGAMYSVYYINDVGPQLVSTLPTLAFEQNIPITPFILDNYVQSPEGDTLVWSGALPPALGIVATTYNPGQPNQITVQQIQGTPTTASGASMINLTATDYAGETLAIAIPYSTAAGTTMPNLVGDAYPAALAILSGFGITSITLLQDTSPGVIGTVTAQTPVSTTLISSQTAVTLTVRGFLVPDETGAAITAAVSALEALGLTVTSNATSTTWVVAMQSIPGGTFIFSLPFAIVLTAVSTAGNMPDVRGVLLPEAQQMLQISGILVINSIGYFGPWPITVIWEKSAQTPGIVLDQNPEPGNQVAPNAPITLTVAEFPIATAYP